MNAQFIVLMTVAKDDRQIPEKKSGNSTIFSSISLSFFKNHIIILIS